MQLHLLIPGVPVAQPRQRHRVVTANGKTFTQNYTPKSSPVNLFKANVQFVAMHIILETPGFVVLECPIRMDVVFVFSRPASAKKANKGRLPHDVKPDRDNVLKAVQDALEGILYRNDSQVFAGSVDKYRAAIGEVAHTEVRLEW